ncbi:MAG TPA: response regulator [Acidobacteriaceae bacterium]
MVIPFPDSINQPARPVVAIVDDDFRVRESLEGLIESSGFTARVFPLAEDFLQAGLQETSCLITDVRMPCMSGLDLQRRIRIERPELPVIFITGHHDEEAEQSAIAEGAASFIRKPFDTGELLRAIHTALDDSSGKQRKAL